MSYTRVSLLLRLRDFSNFESWAEFVRVYTPVIKNTIYRFGLSQADTEDVFQEVLLQMMRTMQKFEKDPTKGHFRNFLTTVTTNKVRDLLRKKLRKSGGIENPAQIPDKSRSEEIWEDELNRSLFRIAAEKTEASSRRETWDCFQCHVLEKRSAFEVSRDLGITENAVYVNSSRVLSRIKLTALKLKSEYYCADK